jgi:hypothetical protein
MFVVVVREGSPKHGGEWCWSAWQYKVGFRAIFLAGDKTFSDSSTMEEFSLLGDPRPRDLPNPVSTRPASSTALAGRVIFSSPMGFGACLPKQTQLFVSGKRRRLALSTVL